VVVNVLAVVVVSASLVGCDLFVSMYGFARSGRRGRGVLKLGSGWRVEARQWGVGVEMSKLWRLGVGTEGCSSVVVMVLGVSESVSRSVGLVVISEVLLITETLLEKFRPHLLLT
jgi:hypothetical protein